MERKSKKEGIYAYIELNHFAVQQKLTQHCKTTIPQLKKKKTLVEFRERIATVVAGVSNLGEGEEKSQSMMSQKYKKMELIEKKETWRIDLGDITSKNRRTRNRWR